MFDGTRVDGGEGEDNSKHFDTLFVIKEIEKWKILFSVISSLTNYVNDLEMFASALIASSTSGAFPLKCSVWLVEVNILEWTGVFVMLNEVMWYMLKDESILSTPPV